MYIACQSYIAIKIVYKFKLITNFQNFPGGLPSKPRNKLGYAMHAEYPLFYFKSVLTKGHARAHTHQGGNEAFEYFEG